jgi:hypothetical protein
MINAINFLSIEEAQNFSHRLVSLWCKLKQRWNPICIFVHISTSQILLYFKLVYKILGYHILFFTFYLVVFNGLSSATDSRENC